MKNKERLKMFKLLFRLTKSYRISFFTLFLCMSITCFTSMLFPYIFGMLVDEVFYHKNIEFFKVIVIGYGILLVGDRLLYLVQFSVWSYLYSRYVFDIRRKLFERVLTAKASFLNNIKTGDVITRIDSDTNDFMNLIQHNLFWVINIFINYILSIVFVALLNVKIATLMFFTVPVSVLISNYFGRKARKQSETYRKSYGDFISWVFEILKGMRDIKLMAAEGSIIRKFKKYCSDIIYIKIKAKMIEFSSSRASSLASLLTTLGVYVLASMLVIKGQVTIGIFVAVMEYFNRANYALSQFVGESISIQQRIACINRVYDLLECDTEKQENSLPRIRVSDGEISFSGVSFGYNENNSILKDIDIHIKGGEHIAVVGRSGAGKSTLASLLLRFYDPDKGIITIDGQDIKKYSLKSLRWAIGVVQQECLLFNDTIRNNLIIGNIRCSEEDMWDACRKAHIAEFVETLPNTLDTVIGRTGIGVSGGQAQRIAIARIFIKNPRILIFDEATSALDFESERIVQNAWEELSKGRSSITIAHRLSTIINSDRVAVLHDGRIVAYDNHLRLLETCEYYRQLFEEQYLQREEKVV